MSENTITENNSSCSAIPVSWICVLALFLSACSGSQNECRDSIKMPCVPVEKPHPKLSDYNVYQDALHNLDPVAGLMPYDLNTQLFSDYAQKQRFVYVPKDSVASYTDKGVFNFPVGSMLIKNFYYDLDQQNPSSDRQILETRFLIHQEDGWRAQTYIWNEQQDEAFLQLAGAQKEVQWKDKQGLNQNVNFLIPTQNDCKTCHSHNGQLLPIGPEAQNLNKEYPFNDGSQNQLVKWEEVEILEGLPDLSDVSKVPVWDDPSTGSLDQRARIYLDVNCANCHNRGGSANNSGLFLGYDEKNKRSYGIYKPPVAAGRGSGGLQHDILPGKPDESILVYRMESTHPAVRMPEIGRTLVHDEAVELIREWIQQMEMNRKPSKE